MTQGPLVVKWATSRQVTHDVQGSNLTKSSISQTPKNIHD